MTGAHEIAFGENEVEIKAIRSPGPGGQNVNKVSTAIQLRFDALNSPRLTPDQKNRLRQIAGKRMTSSGILIITASEARTQARNRALALDRLSALIRQARKEPRVRRKTKVPDRAKEKRLEKKRLHSKIKNARSGKLEHA